MTVQAPKSFIAQAIIGVGVGVVTVIAILLLLMGLLLAIDTAVGDELEDLRYESSEIRWAVHRLMEDVDIIIDDPLLYEYHCAKKNAYLTVMLEDSLKQLELHPDWEEFIAPTIKIIQDAWCHDYD